MCHKISVFPSTFFFYTQPNSHPVRINVNANATKIRPPSARPQNFQPTRAGSSFTSPSPLTEPLGKPLRVTKKNIKKRKKKLEKKNHSEKATKLGRGLQIVKTFIHNF